MTHHQHQDYVGSAEITLGEILAAGGAKTLALKNAAPSAKLKRAAGVHGLGEVCVFVESVAHESHQQEVCLLLQGRALDKKDLFGKSDPYLQISRDTGRGWVVVYKSEIIKKTLNPKWKEARISTASVQWQPRRGAQI